METEIDYLFKIICIGNPSVGKTSLIKRYVHGIYSQNYKSTIGVDFAVKRVCFPLSNQNNANVTLHFWDLAGQDRFGAQVSIYFRGSHGAICIYDISNNESKESIKKWKSILDDHTGGNVPSILLVNKIDLINENKQLLYYDTSIVKVNDITGNKEIDQHAIDKTAKQLGFSGGFGVSVKNNNFIDDAMKFLINIIIMQYETYDIPLECEKGDIIDLTETQNKSSIETKNNVKEVTCCGL